MINKPIKLPLPKPITIPELPSSVSSTSNTLYIIAQGLKNLWFIHKVIGWRNSVRLWFNNKGKGGIWS